MYLRSGSGSEFLFEPVNSVLFDLAKISISLGFGFYFGLLVIPEEAGAGRCSAHIIILAVLSILFFRQVPV
jgi:hypothetical protein